MKEMLKEVFTYTKSQRRGILLLVCILIAVHAVRGLFPGSKEADHYDMSGFMAAAEKFEQEIRQADSLKKARELKKDTLRWARHESDTIKQNTNFYNPRAEKFRDPMPFNAPIVSINTADSLDLLLLRGIGPSFSGRIIKYRKALGGFYSGIQLLEVYGMDSTRYELFKDQIMVDTSGIRKINLNTVNFKELLKHPYFEYPAVKAIISHRDRNGPFQSIEQIEDLNQIYPELFEKIKPYICVDCE